MKKEILPASADICTPTFTSALITTAKGVKNLVEYVNEMWCTKASEGSYASIRQTTL